MHCVLWGTYDEGKPRVRILRRGLLENGVVLRECHTAVWTGIEDKSQVHTLWARLGLLLRWVGAYPGLLWRYLRLPAHDVVLVSYLGHLDILVLWPFAKLRRVPIVWDAFLSLYNTVVEDRKLIGRRHPLALFLYSWEWLACRAADLVVLDTAAHAAYFQKQFHLAPGKATHAFVGAEPEAFPQLLRKSRVPGTPVTVLFYGQFIPLHGLETIVSAARLLKDAAVEWILIGQGQETDKIDAMLAEAPLPKVQKISWVAYAELQAWLDKADLCLGIFGVSEKASMVIPNKVFQILLSGKPVLTRDSPAIRELGLTDTAGLSLIPAGDAQGLADAVLRFAQTSDVGTDDASYGSWLERITPRAIGKKLHGDIQAVLAKRQT